MPQASSDRIPDRRAEAVNALNHGDSAEAQRLLAQVLRSQPNDDEAWALMAMAQTDSQRRQDCLDRALNLNPHNATALAQRAQAAPAPTWPEPAALSSPTPSSRPAWPEPAAPSSPTHATMPAWPEPAASSNPGHSTMPTWPEPVASADIAEPEPEAIVAQPRRLDRRTQIEQARSAPPSFAAAQTLTELGQIASARDMLRKVVAASPDDEAAWLALIDLIDDDPERALVIQEAAERFPRNAILASAIALPAPTIQDPAGATETLWSVPVKTPLEMIQERAAREGERVGPIRAKRVARSDNPQIFFEVWMSALLGPSKSNFQDILQDNPPSLLTAMTWMGLCGGIATLIQIGLAFWTQPQLGELLSQVDRTTLMIASGVVIVLVWILPGLGLLFNSLAVSVASVVVGGNIDIRAQAYLTAAWQAPLTLLTSFMAFVPFLNIVGGLALVIYEVVLSISATQAAQDLEGFQAVVALMLSFVVLALPICLIGALPTSSALEAVQFLEQFGR